MTEVLLSPRTTLTGKTLKDLLFREHYGISVLAIWRNGHAFRTGLQDMPLKFGDALLVYGQRKSSRPWPGTLISSYLIRRRCRHPAWKKRALPPQSWCR